MKVGGSEKQALYLLTLLNDSHNTSLVVFNNQIDDIYLDYIKQRQLSVFFLDGPFVYKLIQFYKLLKKNHVDIIFSYLFNNNVVGSIVGKLAGVKLLVGGFRGSRSLNKSRMLLFKWIHNHISNLTISNSTAGYNLLLKNGFIYSKLLIIHNGIELNQNYPKEIDLKKSKKIIILTVSRYHSDKDHKTAIMAVDFLKNKLQIDNFNYQIIGYGDEALKLKIEEMIDKLDLNNEVCIIDSPIDTDKYFAKADIYLSTSTFEGFSNSIMEAMTYKLPIVATAVGGNIDLIINNRSGFLCKVKDYQMIAKKLNVLFESRKLRKTIGQNGYNQILEHYTLEKLNKQYLQIINDLK